MDTTCPLADDATVVQRILDHIDRKTTDLGERTWREPVANYRSEARFAAERERVLRRTPTPFCPSAALPDVGSYLAREAAGTPLLAVRASDGRVRVFRNACRHRGASLAEGAGCTRAFVCRYHGWTYGTDGRLKHVPSEHGFPGLDKATRGLSPVAAVERQGVVFVVQDAPLAEGERLAFGELGGLPLLIPSGHRVLAAGERDVAANWKIFVESFLEGYHIRSTHPQTFYPIQYDNLNVVERFGRNNRVAFPYQAVEELRGAPPEARSAEGKLTYVYHLFPNVLVATFPGRLVMVVLEPQAVDRTRLVTWVLSDRDPSDPTSGARLKRGGDLVDAGGAEDREVVCAIQRSLASGANEFFEFGLFESAIVHFHEALAEALGAAA
jgi:phenylpropionate dioxygenase-like ring-hydroxylating dioxygenase large terminal subunit